MDKPYIIVFSGVPGVSKTPISHYLSCEFNLPIINSDQIRFEVKEDLRLDNINKPGGVEEFEKRLNFRFDKLLDTKKTFIYDGSMDRRWAEFKRKLIKSDYKWFMINIELSREFIVELFNETGRGSKAIDQLDSYLLQHKEFMNKFNKDITIQIEDDEFKNRLNVTGNRLRKFLLTNN